MATWRRLVLAYIHGKAAKCRNNLGSWWLKSAKNKFSLCDFTRFFKPIFIKFFFHFRFWTLHGIYIQKLSISCRPKCNQSISWIFWISFSAGFFYLAQLCDTAAALKIDFFSRDDDNKVLKIWPDIWHFKSAAVNTYASTIQWSQTFYRVVLHQKSFFSKKCLTKDSSNCLRMEFRRRFQIGFGSIVASGGWDIDACLGRLNNANDLGWRAWECCKKSEYRPGKIHKRRSDSSEIFIKSNLFVETLGYYFEIENSSTLITKERLETLWFHALCT